VLKASFDKTDLKRLEKLFNRLPDNVAEKHLEKGVKLASEVVRTEVKSRAPVQTGRLEGSIVSRRQNQVGGLRRYIRTFFVMGSKKGFYWHMVEYGTSRMSARPFMRPAFAASYRTAAQTFATYMKQAIKFEALKRKV